jgi:hypothetical protein
MGRRSRKRSVGSAAGTARASGGPPSEAPRRVRGEERDAILRAGLTPLAAGERPAPLKAAVIVSVTLAILNPLFWAAGVDVRGEKPALSGVLAFALIMLVAAWGMWTQRYWAVLGFQALLAITLVIAGLSLMVAGNLWAVLLCVAILGLGGWLFWALVRVLGRMKVPRPGPGRPSA